MQLMQFGLTGWNSHCSLFLSKGTIETSRGSIWRQWSPFKPTDAWPHWGQDAKFLCRFSLGLCNHTTRLTGHWLIKIELREAHFQWSETQPSCTTYVLDSFSADYMSVDWTKKIVYSSDSYFSNIQQNSFKSTPHTNLHSFQVWHCSLSFNAQAETR